VRGAVFLGNRKGAPPCWRLEQADEAYRSFDTQSTGKGVFLF